MKNEFVGMIKINEAEFRMNKATFTVKGIIPLLVELYEDCTDSFIEDADTVPSIKQFGLMTERKMSEIRDKLKELNYERNIRVNIQSEKNNNQWVVSRYIKYEGLFTAFDFLFLFNQFIHYLIEDGENITFEEVLDVLEELYNNRMD